MSGAGWTTLAVVLLIAGLVLFVLSRPLRREVRTPSTRRPRGFHPPGQGYQPIETGPQGPPPPGGTAVVTSGPDMEVVLLKAARAEDQHRLLLLEYEVDRYIDGIRAHRDARGDDRCWRDDEALYKLLPEGYAPPAVDSAVELERCRQFIASRQHPATLYVSPQRQIEKLEEIVRSFAAHPVECRSALDEPCSCGLAERLAAVGVELEP